jgi:hypothetical protein
MGCIGLHENSEGCNLLKIRAGDGDRTRDVQGRKSLDVETPFSVTAKRPFGTPWVQPCIRDDAILGSF